MKRFTMVALAGFVLTLLATTSFAQDPPVRGTQQDLRFITGQFKEIAADYLPGTPYEKSMNDLVLRVEAMSEDESRYLKPLIPGMLANLKMFKEALAGLDTPQAMLFAAQTAAEFPNAEYPNIQLSAYPGLALPALTDALNILPTAISFFTNGASLAANEWTSSWVNAAPLTCVTRVDADGIPIRTPDLTMQTLRTALQVAEAIKEGANCVLEQVLVGVGAGANLKWLTIVPTGIWLVEKAVYENMKECDDMISGAEAGAAYQRLGHIHGDVTDLNIKTDAAQGDLSSIRSSLTKIETQLDTVIKLLNTPQGLRPDFPTKK